MEGSKKRRYMWLPALYCSSPDHPPTPAVHPTPYSLSFTWEVDGTGVGHGGVQEEAVHVVACVVVLLDVAPAALDGVAAPQVRQVQQPVTQPVEDAQGASASLHVVGEEAEGGGGGKDCCDLHAMLIWHYLIYYRRGPII